MHQQVVFLTGAEAAKPLSTARTQMQRCWLVKLIQYFYHQDVALSQRRAQAALDQSLRDRGRRGRIQLLFVASSFSFHRARLRTS